MKAQHMMVRLPRQLRQLVGDDARHRLEIRGMPIIRRHNAQRRHAPLFEQAFEEHIGRGCRGGRGVLRIHREDDEPIDAGLRIISSTTLATGGLPTFVCRKADWGCWAVWLAAARFGVSRSSGGTARPAVLSQMRAYLAADRAGRFQRTS